MVPHPPLPLPLLLPSCPPHSLLVR
jgi:hypothetical protein